MSIYMLTLLASWTVALQAILSLSLPPPLSLSSIPSLSASVCLKGVAGATHVWAWVLHFMIVVSKSLEPLPPSLLLLRSLGPYFFPFFVCLIPSLREHLALACRWTCKTQIDR